MLNRKNLLAALHCLKRDLKMSDAAYEGFLIEAFGVYSAANMTDEQLQSACGKLRYAKGHVDEHGCKLPKFASVLATGDVDLISQKQINFMRALWGQYARNNSVHCLEDWLFSNFKTAKIETMRRFTASKAIKILQKMADAEQCKMAEKTPGVSYAKPGPMYEQSEVTEEAAPQAVAA